MTIQDIDVFWVLLCACLVWIMQAGFLCLETGLTRSKNNINVALKNICDNATSIFLFWMVGFSIAFGVPFDDPLNWDNNFYFFQSGDNKVNAFFVFQAVFCSTCCTIVSGAAAERLKFAMYPVLVAIIAALIYPVVVNAAWGGTMLNNGLGLLVANGFYDFAGSTVVHSTGGWVALALILVTGPRLGRFDANGHPQTIQGSNLTLSSLGVLILWFGWLGFNGGSAYNFSSDIGIILSNTLIAGATSLVCTLLLISRRKRTPAAEDLINGALGGLVGITASANCVSSVSAALIGAGSAVSVLIASRLLLRYRLDDVVGAVPVHLAAGIWGTLAVGLFGDLGIINSGLTRAEQLSSQLAGVGFTAIWAFGIAYLLIRLINHYYPFRVSKEDESIGLNISEHGATSELYELLAFMKYQSDTGSLSSHAPSDLFTETGVIGMAYNHVMTTLRENDHKLRTMNGQLESANANLKAYDMMVAHDLKNPISVIRSYAALIDQDNQSEEDRKRYVELIRRSSEDAMSIIKGLLNFSRAQNEVLQSEITHLPELLYKIQIQLYGLIEEHHVRFESEFRIKNVNFNNFALQQILVNLVSNAIKYTHPERRPLIRLRSSHQSGHDLIQVEDNGLGMDEEQCNHLFQQHNRMHMDIIKEQGYGIGMFNVKRLIEAGGGEVSVTSTPGEGSCITIRLPPSVNPQFFNPSSVQESAI